MSHPLYHAAAILLERGMSHRQLARLKRLFDKHGLVLPLDFAAALEQAGIIFTPTL